MLISCMVIFLELKSLSGIVQMCSPCSSPQVLGHWEILSKRLIFSLTLAVFSSKQSYLVRWCACLSALPWFWAITLLLSYLSHSSSTKPFCFPDLKDSNLQNSHYLSSSLPAMSSPWRDVESATEQLCPSKFRALHAPKCLAWTLEVGAKIRIINTHTLTSQK